MSDKYYIQELTPWETENADSVLNVVYQMLEKIKSEISPCEEDDYEPRFYMGARVYERIISVTRPSIVDNGEKELFGIRFDLDPCLNPDCIKILYSDKRLRWKKFDGYNGRIFFDETDYAKGEKMPKIKKVIFNAPATIVFWADGTKTVVKCNECTMGCECHCGEENAKCREFDQEKGLAMAIVKKISGNKGNYNNVFREWCGND